MSFPISGQNNTGNVREAVVGLLEGGYDGASERVLAAIAREVQSGVVGQRLAELEAEAARLAEAGERLSPDNAVLRAVLADWETALGRNVVRMTDGAEALTGSSIGVAEETARLLTFAGFGEGAALQVGWNAPDIEAVARLVDYTSENAWSELLSTYVTRNIERVTDRAIVNFIQGKGAVASARQIVALVQGLTVSEAETILRTLYLHSTRRSTVATHMANAAILEPETIRVAVLDPRTCMACVALHGSVIPIDQPVDDHWNGRCTKIASVRGFRREIVRGEVWFRSLPRERQLQQRAFSAAGGEGNAMWRAFEDGAIGFDDFAVEVSDPLFGRMVQQASLVGMLGDGAQQYYQK